MYLMDALKEGFRYFIMRNTFNNGRFRKINSKYLRNIYTRGTRIYALFTGQLLV